MGTYNASTIRALNVRAKVSLVTVLTLLMSIFICQGWYSPGSADAAITRQANWSSQYAAVAYPAGALNAGYTIAAGTNRLLVVAIASTSTATGTQAVSNVTYGGKPLALAAGDSAATGTWNHSYLYYLKEADIQAATGTSLNVTITGGTGYYTYVYAAVYAGVDLTTPFTDARNYNSTSTANGTVGPFNPTLTIAANDQAVEIVNLARSSSGTTPRAITGWATGWAAANIAPTPIATSGPCATLYIRDRTLLTAANDGSQHTADSTSTWDSMTAMSIKPAWPKVGTFVATTPSTSRNIPISAFAAEVSVPVTGYIITTSATPPASGAAGWTSTAPATYTVGSDGSFTIYPWVKNAAGEVSTVFASPVTVVADTVKPTVTTTIPANGATNVTLNSSITINWSEPVNCNTVTTSNITVNGGTLTRTSCSGSQAVFSASDQAYNTLYAVTVGTGVTDANGNAMNAVYPFSFTNGSNPNLTVVGTATATAAGATNIKVSMPYTIDGNANNTYTVDYKLTSDGTWTNWVTEDTHGASPYNTTITGLSPVTSYDVRVTWNDADGVTGTNPQTFTGITTPFWSMIADQATSPATATYTASDGLFRAMVVAVTTEYSASSTTTTSVTFGGTAMTQAVSDDTSSSSRVHTALFYLKDNQIPAGAQTFNISASTGSLVNITAYVATFTGVDQATTITNTQKFNSTGTTTPALPALTVNSGDQAIYVSNIYNTTNSTIPTNNIPVNWTSQQNDTGTSGGFNWRTEVSNRSVPGSNTTDTAGFTINTSSRVSLSGMSLKYVGACVRVNPTVTIAPATNKIIPGASVNYTVSVKNNDTGGCVPTTFFLSNTDIPVVPNTNFSTSSLSAATIGPIGVGATQTVTLTHTADDGATAGQTEKTSVTTAADGVHTAVTSTQVTSTVVVSNGKMLYSNNTTTPQYRIYTNLSNTLGAETATLVNAIPTFMVEKACAIRNEHIAGYVTTGGVLYIMRWDGTKWTNEWNITIPGYDGVTGRPFDINYRGDGSAIVAYSLGTGNAQQFAYQIWDGGSWTVPTTVTMSTLNAAGIVVSLKIASKQTGSDCTIAAQDSSSYLSAAVYYAGVFGNEKQLSTTVYRNTNSGDVPAFDLAYETTSGDLLVVNTQGTTINYWTYSLISNIWTWTGPTSLAGIGSTTGAIFAVADPNTGSNSILVAATRNVGSGSYPIYAQIWNGTAFSSTNTSASLASSLVQNSMPLNGGFVKSGVTTTAAVIVYNDGTVNRLGYSYTTDGGTNWTATNTTAVTISNGMKAWIDAAQYPQSMDTMMVTLSDGANDLWAKRMVYGGGTTFTWTNADGGTALTSSLTNITTRNFSFAYDKTKTMLADGIAANSSSVCPASAGQKINGFSFQTTQSTDSVTALTVTTTNQAAIASMEIWNEGGTTKYFGTVNNPGSNTWNFSGGTPIPISPTPTNCKILVTYKGHGTAPVANTDTSATVTAYTSTNSKYGVDTTEATITLDNAPASSAAWGTTSGGTGSAALDWNIDLAGNNVLIVRYAANTDVTMPAEGTLYVANTAYGTGGTVVYVGADTTFTDDGNGALLAGGTYYYRIFAYDGCNNYATSAPWTAGIVVSSPYPTITGTASASASSISSVAVSMPYTGDTNLNNTLKVEYKLTASGSWTTWSGPVTHPSSPYSTAITGLTPGQSYDVQCTYTDTNGIIGTAVQTITAIVLPVNGTTAGLATASVTSPTTLQVNAPFSDDFNGNNTYTVKWKLSSDGSYAPVNTINGSHSASPFTATISDLAAETSYDVFVAWNDPDGVANSPQTISSIVTPYPLTNMNLIHNSTNTTNKLNDNSMKWTASGGWGVSGGKYGAFSCTVCHSPKTSNVFRVKTGITVLDTSKGNIPGGSNSPVTFQSKTLTNSYGNYSTNGYSNSQRICETCHSATSYHKYTQTKLHHEEDAGLKDCIVCHDHNKGFKPIGACTICHAKPQGARAAIFGQFTANGNSHHIQGVKVTDQLCYQCHWEANIDGTVNTAYHGGSLTSGAPVRLVRYKNGLRPTVYKDMTSAVLYTANGSRTEFQKINNHCLGCHSAPSNSTQPFVDGKSPKQYAWDGKSIDERYSQTGTTPWGKYSDTATTNVSPKDAQIKAFSAHGNAGANKRGWNLNETWPNTSGSVNVLCYDCHNSHGSAASGVTSNYSSATGKYKGAILKSTAAGKGGYSVTYKPQSGGSVATKDAYNTGAGLCFDCHNSANSGTKPWGYTDTYGSSQPVMGYWDTPYFTTGTFASTLRYIYKASNSSHKGGHFGASSGMNTPTTSSINGLCTPCHDPHGVSPTLGANQKYGVPLLKGTWMTSPYKEDSAPLGKTEPRGGGEKVSVKNVGSTPNYHIDQNTLGLETKPSQGDYTLSVKWNFTDTTSRISEDVIKFGGLCVMCHTQSDIAPNAASAAPTWKSMDRVHNTVKGWGSATGSTGNASNAAHSYTCSKCHTVHNSRLPRLLVTNCLDFKHRGQVASGGVPVISRSVSQGDGGGGGSGGFAGGGGGRYDRKGSPQGSDKAPKKNGEWFFGSRTAPTSSSAGGGYKACHDTANTVDGSYPAKELWNTKSPW